MISYKQLSHHKEREHASRAIACVILAADTVTSSIVLMYHGH